MSGSSPSPSTAGGESGGSGRGDRQQQPQSQQSHSTEKPATPAAAAGRHRRRQSSISIQRDAPSSALSTPRSSFSTPGSQLPSFARATSSSHKRQLSISIGVVEAATSGARIRAGGGGGSAASQVSTPGSSRSHSPQPSPLEVVSAGISGGGGRSRSNSLASNASTSSSISTSSSAFTSESKKKSSSSHRRTQSSAVQGSSSAAAAGAAAPSKRLLAPRHTRADSSTLHPESPRGGKPSSPRAATGRTSSTGSASVKRSPLSLSSTASRVVGPIHEEGASEGVTEHKLPALVDPDMAATIQQQADTILSLQATHDKQAQELADQSRLLNLLQADKRALNADLEETRLVVQDLRYASYRKQAEHEQAIERQQQRYALLEEEVEEMKRKYMHQRSRARAFRTLLLHTSAGSFVRSYLVKKKMRHLHEEIKQLVGDLKKDELSTDHRSTGDLGLHLPQSEVESYTTEAEVLWDGSVRSLSIIPTDALLNNLLDGLDSLRVCMQNTIELRRTFRSTAQEMFRRTQGLMMENLDMKRDLETLAGGGNQLWKRPGFLPKVLKRMEEEEKEEKRREVEEAEQRKKEAALKAILAPRVPTGRAHRLLPTRPWSARVGGRGSPASSSQAAQSRAMASLPGSPRPVPAVPRPAMEDGLSTPASPFSAASPRRPRPPSVPAHSSRSTPHRSPVASPSAASRHARTITHLHSPSSPSPSPSSSLASSSTTSIQLTANGLVYRHVISTPKSKQRKQLQSPQQMTSRKQRTQAAAAEAASTSPSTAHLHNGWAPAAATMTTADQEEEKCNPSTHSWQSDWQYSHETLPPSLDSSSCRSSPPLPSTSIQYRPHSSDAPSPLSNGWGDIHSARGSSPPADYGTVTTKGQEAVKAEEEEEDMMVGWREEHDGETSFAHSYYGESTTQHEPTTPSLSWHPSPYPAASPSHSPASPYTSLSSRSFASPPPPPR